ncbi:MAG: methyltransferase domain-containing protein [Gemmataceae bacterium]
MHFERLSPICPLCQVQGRGAFPVEIAAVWHETTYRQTDVPRNDRSGDSETNGVILQGLLHCTNSACQCEYPIIDGIPILVPDVREYVSSRNHQITAREDLADELEGVLSDCCGPGSAYETDRLYASHYAWGHYQDLDKRESANDFQVGDFVRLLGTMVSELLGEQGDKFLDVGCSVGRGTFYLAETTGALSLGVDLNFSMLRLAHRVLRDGVVRYPQRVGGIVYRRREFPVKFPNRKLVDFWACDAMALPFAPDSFDGISALNVLDCVASPIQLLNDLTKLSRPGGRFQLTSPYDWTTAATPLECWIGGHSQRGPYRGSPEMLLRAILTPGAHLQSLPNVQIVTEICDFPWTVRLHERSVVNYRVHGLVVEVLE